MVQAGFCCVRVWFVIVVLASSGTLRLDMYSKNSFLMDF